jgi:hypothetical protein
MLYFYCSIQYAFERKVRKSEKSKKTLRYPLEQKSSVRVLVNQDTNGQRVVTGRKSSNRERGFMDI